MTDVLRGLFANGWLKLSSVLLAVFIWLYVQGEEVEESRLTAQVVWSLPTSLVPVDAPPTSVTLAVKGTRSATRAARAASVRMVVDVSQRERGEHAIDLAMFPTEGLPKNVERSGVSPAVVDLVLDEIASRKLKIRADVVGEPATGFAIAAVGLEPAMVEVRGPRVVVDALSDLRTRPIDVNGLAVTTLRPVDLDLHPALSVVSESPIAARIELVSRIERREVENVPVFVRGSDRHRVLPESVAVTFEGPASMLDGLGAAQVAAFVILPSPAEKPRYEAWLGPRDGVRVEVLHPGGDQVKVTAIAPPSVVVEHE